MTKLTRLAATVVCAAAAFATHAQTALTPAAERITDGAIARDHAGYEALQARIKALNDGGRPLADHHLAKAQCWLDTSFHEYTRNDRGPWPQAALDESLKLVQALEARATPGFETPLVAGAERLRPDLWARAETLRGHTGWRCAAAKAACAQVELVHAGHEHAQLGWRHAKPYVQIAEDLLGEAEAAAAACVPPPAPMAATVAAPVAETPRAPVAVAVAPAPPVVAPAAPGEPMVAHVVFAFDRTAARDVKKPGIDALRTVLRSVRERGLVVRQVLLQGHADRLRGPDAAYNQRLSQARAETVRALLVAEGIPADLIRTEARGDQEPLTACRGRNAGAALRSCLLPDRRVEVVVVAGRP